jgi:UDP-N-acetylglucosamine 2-epimerase (non-hydrolysing)
MMKILLCFGTRPEAIKMAPLYHQLNKQKAFDVEVCVTAQHREMLDQVLDFFEIVPDYDLDVMLPNQTLNGLSAHILSKMDEVFNDVKPDLVLVHGDTTTSSMVALAAFHRGIKVGHIEAGLRTYNKQAPFPEELNRQLTSRIADLHFTPTEQATLNLRHEGIPLSSILETGNTVIDALFWTIKKIESPNYGHPEIATLKNSILQNKKIVLVTGHRRENFGEGFQQLCEALLKISERDDVLIVYPVHLNPNVKDAVYEKLSNKENIQLIPPVSYPAFVWLMQQSFLIVSDSGGIQEEAPSLGKPVLVTRNVTERAEGVTKGFSILVGTDQQKIVMEASKLLDGFKGFDTMENPYGVGHACERIGNFLYTNCKSN